MPELPEVETVRRGLSATLSGATIAKVTLRRKGLRAPFPERMAEILKGRKIERIGRRAKYLLFQLSGGKVLVAHLGMTGRFMVEKKAPSDYAKHDHVIFQLVDGRVVIYNDARRFGLMTVLEKKRLATHALFRELGVEPLSKSFTTAYLRAALETRHAPIKTVLMDQSIVVGVGNIYASEALFLAKIHPKRKASNVAKQATTLILAIRKVLKLAIASGGSSLRDFVQVSGEAGYFQHRFNVYGRRGKPCFYCGIPLRSIRQAGRSSFFCPQCQK